jgi:hypothetical protein
MDWTAPPVRGSAAGLARRAAGSGARPGRPGGQALRAGGTPCTRYRYPNLAIARGPPRPVRGGRPLHRLRKAGTRAVVPPNQPVRGAGPDGIAARDRAGPRHRGRPVVAVARSPPASWTHERGPPAPSRSGRRCRGWWPSAGRPPRPPRPGPRTRRPTRRCAGAAAPRRLPYASRAPQTTDRAEAGHHSAGDWPPCTMRPREKPAVAPDCIEKASTPVPARRVVDVPKIDGWPENSRWRAGPGVLMWHGGAQAAALDRSMTS